MRLQQTYKPHGIFFTLSDTPVIEEKANAFFTYDYRNNQNLILDSLVVWKPSNRTQGFGRELMSEAFQKLHELGYKLVVITSWSQEAEGFYTKLGFKKHKHPEYAKPVLTKRLKNTKLPFWKQWLENLNIL